MSRIVFATILGSLSILVPVIGVEACNVPVFRYALERWEADSYTLTLFHEGPLTEDHKNFVDRLERQRAGNEFILRLVDVAAELDEDDLLLKKAADPQQFPWVYIEYPESDLEWDPVYSGPFDEEQLSGLLMSPMRRRIIDQILAGESVVWLLVNSGDAEKDDKLRSVIQDELKRLEGEIELPKLDETDAQYLTAEAGPELRLSLSLLEMGRDDPREKMFLRLLENWSSEKPVGTQAMVFAFFGRGRVLGPGYGDDLDMALVDETCRFLAASCSCQVKRENPGWDMLIGFDWNGALSVNNVAAGPESLLDTPDPVADPKQELDQMATDIATLSQKKSDTESGSRRASLDFIPLVLVTIVLALGLVGAATGVIWQRNRERPPT